MTHLVGYDLFVGHTLGDGEMIYTFLLVGGKWEIRLYPQTTEAILYV
jgi:hypothetical protein